MTENLEKMDLTASQGRLMAFLFHRGDSPTYAKDVETTFQLTHPTVSGLLSRLEQKGFIALETEKGGQIHYLTPQDEPKAVFDLNGEKPVAVYEYCNLHGFWKKEL